MSSGRGSSGPEREAYRSLELCQVWEKLRMKGTDARAWSDIGITGEEIHFSVLEDHERVYCRECLSVEMAMCSKVQCEIFLKIERAWKKDPGLVNVFDIVGIELNSPLVNWDLGERLFRDGSTVEQVKKRLDCHISTSKAIKFMLDHP